jgi:hypothetical protein
VLVIYVTRLVVILCPTAAVVHPPSPTFPSDRGPPARDSRDLVSFYIVTYQVGWGGLRELRDVDSDWYLDLFAQVWLITINGNSLATGSSLNQLQPLVNSWTVQRFLLISLLCELSLNRSPSSFCSAGCHSTDLLVPSAVISLNSEPRLVIGRPKRKHTLQWISLQHAALCNGSPLLTL